MTTLYQDELTQTGSTTRADWFHIRSTKTLFTWMICCALVLRIVVVASSFLSIATRSYDHGQFGAEMGWVARSLASGHGFSSPFFPSTGPTALVPKHVAGERPAQLAGWLWAIYPFAIYFSGAQVWDYALTSFLFATCFCFAQRLHFKERTAVWFGFGVLYGVTALSNPSVLSLFPFLLITSLWKVKRVGGRWLLRGILTVVALGVVVGPWAVRNDRVMHAASPIRDGFWLEFWAGNAGDTTVSNPAWAHPASNPVEMQAFEAEGETSYLAHKHILATSFVRHHPLLFAGVSLRRAVRFWTGFWSFRSSYLQSEPLDVPNVFFCTCVTLFMLRGIWRWWREDRSHAIPYLFLLIVFPLPYYLTHSSMDYRQPIESQIVILVTVGIFGFRDWGALAQSQEADAVEWRQHEPELVYRVV